jgi:hypothetical protein
MLLVLIIGWISAEPLNSPITGIKGIYQNCSKFFEKKTSELTISDIVIEKCNVQNNKLGTNTELRYAGPQIKQYQQSGSFLLFISGFISMIGIGWVRKKKI